MNTGKTTEKKLEITIENIIGTTKKHDKIFPEGITWKTKKD